MSVVQKIKEVTATAIHQLYGIELQPADVLVNATKPEFEGDYTVVLFAFIKQLKKSPDALGAELGGHIVATNPDLFTGFNVIKGFLNLSVADAFWLTFLHENYRDDSFGNAPANHEKVMVEYSSPNTNKPLHLGHLRNNFLGRSIAEILKATGNDVVKTCIVNDRGIHICKSMIAWQMFGNGETPESTHTKGDHFVGDYYVKFNNEYKRQTEELKAAGRSQEEAEKEAPVMKATQQMLLDWEAGKPEVMDLWRRMNSWVYEGFDATYERIGSDFDKIYYESDTYLLGKDLVESGLAKGVFYQKPDGSVWIDLTADGLDEKLVRRKDGTSVYITQDIGLAEQKQKEFNASQSIYVVGDEQNYHFKVLKLICQKLGLPSADGIYHLSYGMVELPTGKMKSREGTVVDADDLVAEMVNIAKQKTEELGKVKDFTEEELKELYDTIGLGALKFFLLRVDPKKKMVFNPEESIDFHGFTGPFIQYTHARIKSILRKTRENTDHLIGHLQTESLLPLEKELAIHLEMYPSVLKDAATEHDPSKVAIYVFNLSKIFNSFYTEHSIANAESEEKKILRLQLAQLTAQAIKNGMGVLGIRVPERM
ncbi:arginine--tRNA ligase [Sediminibacterium roseum]|uniref:Arginine--tRNA ligase n=1 Tax=Sediminibacterium roseum TaxID=1978412 RepID=A0ABW9ZVD0_9BACT|nr:arginine--tRNA ligase [Sediminibacterium roseum]NCI51138.1 arginine--tRNA ligase [Sediminibacterium roseum]